MKVLIKILTLFISLNGVSQTYPIIEEFNSGTTWVFTNGAGIQNYGGAENYGTFNIGANPYFNNSTITITSPVYSLTNCASGLTVSFPISGRIENGFDIMSFQYFNAGSWITQSTFTGPQNVTLVYSMPNTATQFRFRLVTDCSVNGYKTTNSSCSLAGYSTTCSPAPGNCSGLVSVYYYDIMRFTINCIIPLPIELISFEGKSSDCIDNEFIWITAAEFNSDYFELEQSTDGINFLSIYTVNSKNELKTTSYNYQFNYSRDIAYYRLKQVDFNGDYTYSNTIFIESHCEHSTIKRRFDLIGQEVNDQYKGPVIIEYNDGSIIKKFNN